MYWWRIHQCVLCLPIINAIANPRSNPLHSTLQMSLAFDRLRIHKSLYKMVYEVLKFAKNHTHPIHFDRSAFTYCEDELPSRLDLGKENWRTLHNWTGRGCKRFLGNFMHFTNSWANYDDWFFNSRNSVIFWPSEKAETCSYGQLQHRMSQGWYHWH